MPKHTHLFTHKHLLFHMSRVGGVFGGNLTHSCVLGMTSLGASREGLGVVTATGGPGGVGGENGAEGESWIPLFYLSGDREIQINSCQSGGVPGPRPVAVGGRGGQEMVWLMRWESNPVWIFKLQIKLKILYKLFFLRQSQHSRSHVFTFSLLF